MYIVDGIAYAGELRQGIKVREVRAFDNMTMLLTFDTGEQRIFDAAGLVEYEAFKPLKDIAVFLKPEIQYGVVTWADGAIDIAPETMYAKSYAYENRISS